MRSTPKNTVPAPLEELPGHYIRRLQQIAVAIFLEETQPYGITPVQFAALTEVHRQAGIDQRTLARSIGYDAATIGSVINRLEARGLMLRAAHSGDRRVRLLALTADGEDLLRQVQPAMRRAQLRMLEPLPAAQRKEFMAMLKTLVKANNAFSRAPRVQADSGAGRRGKT